MRELINWFGFRVDPDNVPLPVPGVYLFTNLVNGKHYVGISQSVRARLVEHARGASPPRLRSSIAHHGKENFLVEPVFYSTDGTGELPLIEAMYIQDYDSVRSGYNIMERHGSVGPYGPVFGAILKKVWATPETRARHEAAFTDELRETIASNTRRVWSDPEKRQAISDAIRLAYTDSVVKDRHRSALRAALATPENRAIKSAAMTIVNGRPDVRARHSARVSNLVWITDGARNRRVPREDPVPNGWRPGRATGVVSYGPAIGTVTYKWITDGITSHHVDRDAVVPDGWRLGKAPWKKKTIA